MLQTLRGNYSRVALGSVYLLNTIIIRRSDTKELINNLALFVGTFGLDYIRKKIIKVNLLEQPKTLG